LFSKGHISGALAELIRSTRAATKDRLIGKIMGGNPVFRGTRVPVPAWPRSGNADGAALDGLSGPALEPLDPSDATAGNAGSTVDETKWPL
jgi:hypothetical protein